MRDLKSRLKNVLALAAASYSADNTPVAVDRAGYESAMLVLNIGVGGITFDGSNKIEFKLTHSDDNSTYTAVTDDDMVGLTVGSGGIIQSLIAAHAAAATYKFGYIGGKRYLKLLADFTGTHGTATPLSATWELGDPAMAPVA